MGKDLADLVIRNRTSPVFVKHFESLLEFLIRKHNFFRNCRNDELRIVNLATSVEIYLLKHVINILVGQVFSEIILPAILNFFFGQLGISIFVHEPKHLVDVFSLFFGDALGGYERISGLN